MKTITAYEMAILSRLAESRDPNDPLMASLNGDVFWVGALILNVDTKLPKSLQNQKGQEIRHMAHKIKEMVTHRPITPRDALKEFVDCVDATGGIIIDPSGHHAPVVDEDWIDIGEAYYKACIALGRDPLIKES